MLPASALSVAARGLRDHLTEVFAAPDTGKVLIGHPNVFLNLSPDEKNNHFLNLFFYHIEHGAYPADGSVLDPFYIRMRCLITPFSVDTKQGNTVTVSAGENDLRVIGAVMAKLHQQPLLLLTANGGAAAQVQVVLAPLSLDDVNHIWVTQGELPYRLSVSYELALAPVPLAKSVDRVKRVGHIQMGISPAAFSGAGLEKSPWLGPNLSTCVDGNRADWSPLLASYVEGEFVRALNFSAANLPEKITIAVAGVPETSASLRWEVWSSSGWAPAGEIVPVTIDRNCLDAAVSIHEVDLPLTGAGQAVLFAERRWSRPDGLQVEVRSNPLLVGAYLEPIT